MYKPLPDSLTIKTSKVNGLGLFTNFFVKKGTNFGVSHMKMNGMLIRTPLGGFINHSDTPNCTKSKYFMTNTNDVKIKHDYTRYDLITLQDIEGGEELTVEYTFYDIKKKQIKTISEQSQDELEPIINAPMMELE
jgi:SET domain-containing protein